MAHQIVKQPNGLYAVWSTVVDDFVMEDATMEDIIAVETEVATAEIKARIESIVSKLEAGRKPYHQFTKTYEELLDKRNRTHCSG